MPFAVTASTQSYKVVGFVGLAGVGKLGERNDVVYVDAFGLLAAVLARAPVPVECGQSLGAYSPVPTTVGSSSAAPIPVSRPVGVARQCQAPFALATGRTAGRVIPKKSLPGASKGGLTDDTNEHRVAAFVAKGVAVRRGDDLAPAAGTRLRMGDTPGHKRVQHGLSASNTAKPALLADEGGGAILTFHTQHYSTDRVNAMATWP